SRRAGLNRFVWDCRHPPARPIEIDPPKEEGWFGPVGPAVPPGTYRVTLRLGDQVASATFEIAKDPRNEATQEDLEAQYALGVRVWRRLSDLNGAVNVARELKQQLERWAPSKEEKDEKDGAAPA